MRLNLFLILFFLSPPLLFAKQQKTYGDIHNAKYLYNYDGDTVTFNIPSLHPVIGEKISIRVDGIDTPEIKGKCQKEKELAKQAKRLVENLLENAKTILLKNIKRGKYFRIVSEVMADDKSLSKILIKNNLAVSYDGGKKVKNWCGE